MRNEINDRMKPRQIRLQEAVSARKQHWIAGLARARFSAMQLLGKN